MSKKILIVDDDELTVRLLEERLQEEGYGTVSAKTGNEAIKQTIIEKPDAVIMDIMLPDMQGSDAVKCLQESKDVPASMGIIFLSSIVSQDEHGEGGIQVGGQFYPAISKPVDFDQLLSFLEQC